MQGVACRGLRPRVASRGLHQGGCVQGVASKGCIQGVASRGLRPGDYVQGVTSRGVASYPGLLWLSNSPYRQITTLELNLL